MKARPCQAPTELGCDSYAGKYDHLRILKGSGRSARGANPGQLDWGQSPGGRPVTERVMLVNVGNQPHRDNDEGLASSLPLTRFLL